MPIAQAGEVELELERSGSGPPLLLIMGMSGTRAHWGEPFLRLLREDFEVIAYDHRGVRRSSRVESPFTISDLAADAVGLLDALGIESAHVLGISMGGMVAQEMALSHPQRLRTLTLGCTYCGGPGSALMGEDAMQELAAGMASGVREDAVRAAWAVNVSPSFAAEEQAAARFLEIGRAHAVATAVVMRQMQAIAGHDTSGRLGGLQAPTLVVHGTMDRMLPVANAHQIASLIPGAGLEVMEGVGHLFFWEMPQRAAELIRGQALAHP